MARLFFCRCAVPVNQLLVGQGDGFGADFGFVDDVYVDAVFSDEAV